MEAAEKKSRVTDFFEQLDQSRAGDAQRYGRLVSGPCNVGNTSSHANTEVRERTLDLDSTWMETFWELQVLLAKTNAGLHCGGM